MFIAEGHENENLNSISRKQLFYKILTNISVNYVIYLYIFRNKMNRNNRLHKLPRYTKKLKFDLLSYCTK